MTGRELRARVEAITDLLTDIEAFLEEKGVEDEYGLVGLAGDTLDDLFYLIPLEED